MKSILVYQDEGVDSFCVHSLVSSLQEERVHERYVISLVDRRVFQTNDWQDCTDLVIFPGGRDIPYHQALQGLGNHHIAQFVHSGGSFLGFCAGAYYGCKSIEFEKGGPLEVLADRELQFFPGIARGPALGLGKFSYTGLEGAQLAQLSTATAMTAAYYNGGCFFVSADAYEEVSVLARYQALEEQSAAIVRCKVGKGQAILSGVHPECSVLCLQQAPLVAKEDLESLQLIEEQRKALFRELLRCSLSSF